jgi:hypothetical protein
MRGPFQLWPSQIDMHVTPRVGGVFLLAKDPKKVAFIGRVDKDLREAIKAQGDKYRFFWFESVPGRTEQFLNHCRLFHKYEAGGLDDATHPTGSDLKCPVCGK